MFLIIMCHRKNLKESIILILFRDQKKSYYDAVLITVAHKKFKLSEQKFFYIFTKR